MVGGECKEDKGNDRGEAPETGKHMVGVLGALNTNVAESLASKEHGWKDIRPYHKTYFSYINDFLFNSKHKKEPLLHCRHQPCYQRISNSVK